MGRGRAKAKQTKVARDLKYQSHQTDFGALARELHGDDHQKRDTETSGSHSAGNDDDDEWAGYSESRSRD